MLGAVITFVGFLLAISWCVLYKRFGKFRKGEESLPILLFAIYCVLSFLLLGFFLSVVFSIIPEFLPRPYKHQLDNSPEILFSFVFLIVISFIAYQCYQYIKIVKQNNRNNKSNYTISNRLSETKREIPSDQRDYASNDSFASTISDEVRFCKYCGTRIDNETIYCPHCGKRIQEDRFRSTSTTMSKNCLTEDSNEPLSDIRESNSLINGQHESSMESPDNNAQETNVIQNSFSEINSSEEMDDGKEKNDSHKGKKGAMQDGKFIILFIISVIIICAFFILNTSHDNSKYKSVDVDSIEVNDSIAVVDYVENYDYDSPLGKYKYTGATINGVPEDNDAGEAFFTDGRYYKGPFEDGNLTGKNALFRYPNGDEFRGTFKDNAFYEGTYTIAEDGSYFTGTFKNGQPDKGTWYDKNGIVIE